MADKKERQKKSIAKLIRKEKFDKLRKVANQEDEELMIFLAKECATKKSSDCENYVLSLIDTPLESVKLAVLETLAAIASERVTSTLFLMYDRTPAENKTLRDAILKAIHTIKDRAAKEKE